MSNLLITKEKGKYTATCSCGGVVKGKFDSVNELVREYAMNHTHKRGK